MEIIDEICKLCLKKCENFKAIEENIQNAFDVLLPKIDLTVIQGSVMCQNCAEMLQKCFDFKEKCLHTHNSIVPFVNKDNLELDLRDVYLSKNVTGTDVSEDEDVCVLCMGLVKNCITPDVEEGDVVVKKMIEQCLSELDLSIIKKPVICVHCRESLEDCFHFVTNCLMIEENVKKCCETVDINSKSQIVLSSLSQFTKRDAGTSKVDDISVGKIKVEEQFCEDRENPGEINIDRGSDMIKLEQMCFGDSEGADDYVENKYDGLMEIDDQKLNIEQKFSSNNLWACEENETKLNEENLAEMEDQKFLVDKEIEVKTEEPDFDRLENGIILPQSEVDMKLHRREEEQSTVYDKDQMHKCESCLFQTDRKYNLKMHELTHKVPSEVPMYRCDSCPFQTKYNNSIKNHLLCHKDPSEVTMYKCDSCLFITMCKYKFKIHLTKHADPSDLPKYKCDSCSFQSKYKNRYNSHLLKHQDPSELTTYECASCPFKTASKNRLNRHLLKHKVVTMYKCASCSLQTKSKETLARHSLIHKDPSELTMYKCDSCSYQTKWKRYLRSHLRIHKDPSQVTVHKCDSCSFQTNSSRNLKKHSLRHKDPSEVTVYKCDRCSFETRHKEVMPRHSLTHKDPSELTMYECDSCSYQTKWKHYLKSHFRIHKNPSQITVQM